MEDSRRTRGGLVAEIIGPSGSGKSTLLAALCRRNPEIVPLPVPGRLQQLPHHLRNAALLLPGLLRRPRALWRFSRAEARAMSYLRAWRGPVERLRGPGGRLLLMDQGPVFRLAYLRACGSPALEASPAFARWWEASCAGWGRELDLLIWLDGPDELLLERVRRRPIPHPIQTLDDAGARAFLARYRSGFEAVLARLPVGAGPAVLRPAGAGGSVDALVETVLEALAQRASAA